MVAAGSSASCPSRASAALLTELREPAAATSPLGHDREQACCLLPSRREELRTKRFEELGLSAENMHP
jgi:hypothetical protein